MILQVYPKQQGFFSLLIQGIFSEPNRKGESGAGETAMDQNGQMIVESLGFFYQTCNYSFPKKLGFVRLFWAFFWYNSETWLFPGILVGFPYGLTSPPPGWGRYHLPRKFLMVKFYHHLPRYRLEQHNLVV